MAECSPGARAVSTRRPFGSTVRWTSPQSSPRVRPRAARTRRGSAGSAPPRGPGPFARLSWFTRFGRRMLVLARCAGLPGPTFGHSTLLAHRRPRHHHARLRAGLRRRSREPQGEHRTPPERAVAADRTAVLFDHLLRERQPQAGAPLLRGVERFEDPRLGIWGDAPACICDLHLHTTLDRAGPDGEGPPTRHRLA